MKKNLHAAAHACLVETSIEGKLALAAQAWADYRAGELEIVPIELSEVELAGRPEKPELVPPAEVIQRKIGTPEGKAALIHAVAHIEFNAINLASDAAWRFQDMPEAYYADWLQIAAEEAYHFSLLQERLGQLGYTYGDFPAHNGLWELAQKTTDDTLKRMALVPRVMEARGLDVTPGMSRRFEAVGDDRMVEILAIILRDEVGHVEAGSRWYHYLCKQRGVDADSYYIDLMNEYFAGGLKCPLHKPARLKAGFSEQELEHLESLCKK